MIHTMTLDNNNIMDDELYEVLPLINANKIVRTAKNHKHTCYLLA